MNEVEIRLQELLGKNLGLEGFDIVDLVQIPTRGDRMVRLRTLEEALDELDSPDSQGTVGYLVQVRQRGVGSEHPTPIQQGMQLESFEIGKTGDESVFARLADETLARAASERATLLRSAADMIQSGNVRVEDAALQAKSPAHSGLHNSPLSTPQAPAQPLAAGLELVYLPNGKLNLPYLSRNAELLFVAGEYALAKNVYRTILQSGERSAIALYWIGRCLEAEGKHDEARASYEDSLTYTPALDTFQHLAALLIRAGKDQQAAELLERALLLKDIPSATRFEIHKACGNCWGRASLPDHAEAHYRKALEIDPAADAILTNLGAMHLRAGRSKEARMCFQDAITCNPRNDKAVAGLGSCYLAEGDRRAAHDCFARALDIELNNPTAIFHLVRAAYEIKSYATAARIVAEYVQIAPVNANLLYSLAGLQFHLGRLGESRQSVARILELKPDHAGARELQGLIEKYSAGGLPTG